jgi:hypothetical protein
MRYLGYIALKEYALATQEKVGAVLSGFVGLLSSNEKLFLKDASDEPDRVLTEGLQFITNSNILTKLRDNNNWTGNIYSAGDITIGDNTSIPTAEVVFIGQKLYYQIPSAGPYFLIQVDNNGIIFRNAITVNSTYSATISGGSGTIPQSTHKLVPSDHYSIEVMEMDALQNIIHEISYLIDSDGIISWTAVPVLPSCTIIIRS